MTQGASNWLSPLLGIGITIFSSVIGFVIKQVYDRQKLDIARLTERNKDLKEDHAKEVQRLTSKLEDAEIREKYAMENLREDHSREVQRLTRKLEASMQNEKDSLEALLSIVQSIDASTFGSEDLAKVQKLRNRLDLLMSPEVQKPLTDCKKAAQWVKYRKDDWVGEALDLAVQSHQSLIPRNQKPELQRDMEGYLRWLCDCLQVGHTQNRPISSYVGTPAINTPFLYADALDQLRRKEDYGRLSETQAGFLDDFFRKLIERVSDEATS